MCAVTVPLRLTLFFTINSDYETRGIIINNLHKVKRFFVGKPLHNEALEGERFGVGWGLPILSSDAISSVAYAGQEMLAILIPAIGILAFKQLTLISGAILVLLITLVLSYRQIITCHPNGGGAYTVAKENIGTRTGIIAGSALAIDYIMTVAVSISSGVQQIASAFEPIKGFEVPICIVLVGVMMLGNLRGMRESSKIFGIPTYAFIFGILVMLIVGFYKVIVGDKPIETPAEPIGNATQSITALLILKAFSNGCTALTGVEAISNGVPNFKKPAVKHAKIVLTLLLVIIVTLFGGTALLFNFYKINPSGDALLVLVAHQIFGNSLMYYYITFTTFVILVIAANTAFSGFPMLISIMSRDGYMPRQFSMRGDRLSYDKGIILLSVVASLLIFVFRAKVEALIGLYAIGVFISFTLSQSGMFLRWLRLRKEDKHWFHKALINGLGAVMTATAVVIIAITKFKHGAWIVIFLIPVMVFFMERVKGHYNSVHDKLKIKPEDYEGVLSKDKIYQNRVIVPIDSVNKASVRALRYAKTISDNVTAFNVVIDEDSQQKNEQRYQQLHTDIPLVIKYSPYREVVEPLLEFISSAEYGLTEGEIVSVILPQFRVQKRWHNILHNNTTSHIQRALLKHKHIVVCSIPLQLADKDEE